MRIFLGRASGTTAPRVCARSAGSRPRGTILPEADESLIAPEYAYLPVGGSWTTETLDASGARVFSGVPLALDKDDGVHIVYHPYLDAEETEPWVKHSYQPAGGSWTIEMVAAGGETKGGSLGVDAARGVHVSYQDATLDLDELDYAYKPCE